MHLDEIIDWLDGAFGGFPPIPAGEYGAAMEKIFSGKVYQRYLQDQVNRQIIRDYLTNAVLLGVITEGGLAAFAASLASEDGRASLALHMLMSSVEEAMDLPVSTTDTEMLQPLQPEVSGRPRMKLVPN